MYQSYVSKLVTPTGFEPVNAALRGLRLKPLVDGAIAELVYSIRRKISILIDKKLINYLVYLVYIPIFMLKF